MDRPAVKHDQTDPVGEELRQATIEVLRERGFEKLTLEQVA